MQPTQSHTENGAAAAARLTLYQVQPPVSALSGPTNASHLRPLTAQTCIC